MNLKIRITKNHGNSITIQDLTKVRTDGYLNPWDKETYGRFKPEDTVSISTIVYKRVSTDVLGEIFIIPQTEFFIPIELPIIQDGWAQLVHLVIPSKKWFDKQPQNVLDFYEVVYYIDGMDCYKYFQGKIELIEIHDLLERNPAKTTISKHSDNFFIICDLLECYKKLILEASKELGCNPCIDSTKYNDLIYRRDLVGIIIGVIKHLIHCEDYEEAQKLLERIDGCNGLCKNNTKGNNCGCGGYSSNKHKTNNNGCNC